MKVLIVEDEQLTREQLTKLLLDWGYEVVCAADGNEAWKIFSSEEIRFVITDLIMPELDGIELCKKIRSTSKNYYTYIIAITGASEQKKLFEALFAGADDFVTKPWHNSEVRARLRTGERILHLEDELQERINKLEEANELINKSNEKIRQEITFMSKIQNTLLPSSFSEIKELDICWKHQPHTELAGDGLNIFRIDEDRVAFYMLDVAGTGPAASFLLASLSRKLVSIPGQPGILKYLAIEEPGYVVSKPNKVLARLNNDFPIDKVTNQYFTIFYGIYNLKTREFKYSTAGHPLPFLLSKNGECRRLEGSGSPIGFFTDSEFDLFGTKLKKGDKLFICSDGISEITNTSLKTYGSNNLTRVLSTLHNSTLEESIEQIYQHGLMWGSRHRYIDDVSILAIEFS